MLNIMFITGNAGVGKNTYAEALQEEYNLLDNVHCEIISFAEEVKYIAHRYFDWNGKKDIKGRQLLIDIGQKMREINPNVWVNEMIKKIEWTNSITRNQETIILIPDTRFDNEIVGIINKFDELDNFEYDVIKLKRKFKSKLTKEQQNDVTERGVSETYFTKVVDLNESN